MMNGLLGRASTIGLSAAILAGWSVTAAAEEIIQIDGSSTVFPIAEAVAEEFQIANPSIRVTVGLSGTGGGFKKFCRGETDISNASRPIKASEMSECAAAGISYVEMPVAFDALTVVVNPQNTWAETMTVEQLKTIWEPGAEGKVMAWNQVDASYPSDPLVLFAPGTDSGTFEYFTEAVNGKARASRADFTASEDDNTLVQGVAQEKGGIGYFGLAYFTANADRLKAVKIVNPQGEAVEPSKATVESGTYVPLARPIFSYVRVDALDKPAVAQFVEFYLANAGKLSEEVGYVALPAEAYAKAQEHVNARRAGTVFGGANKIGIPIMDVVNAEASSTPTE
ncbi:MAG: phosphate ABC transporter substrate-binding protein PstS family protein [Alphaproteobacteria bacterium]|nr:phosphate ABC transporter substrate-binding protein PstS family protein [Alphaproteobacteria bacterium]